MKRKMLYLAVCALAVSILLLASPVRAQSTLRVPQDYPSIQSAIDAATDGDTVLVAPGTYFENINFLGKALHLKSTDGPDVTVIDGDRLGSVVTFNHSEGRDSILEGFTIRNGDGYIDGGGIRTLESSPQILNNIIEENFACYGVGISSRFGSPLIQGNLIRYNEREGCTGGHGGAGIYLGDTASPEIIGNIIEYNEIGGAGAGIGVNTAGKPRIERNIIRYNTGSFSGGGIYLANVYDAEIIQNLIYGNDAGKGGGIYWILPIGAQGPRLLNNTIANNDATEGSAVYSRGNVGQVLLENNLLIGKEGQEAVYCYIYSSNLPTFRYNNVFSEGAMAYSTECGDPSGTEGNISVDPLFVDAGGQDFHLFYGSPSIDSGDSSIVDLPTTDMDGRSRILDGDGDGSAIVDMGAYEAFTPTANDRVIGEVGQISNLTHTPKTVMLSRNYDAPVIFAQPLSYDDSDEALVRITLVESDRFTFFVDESPNKNGAHTTEAVSYIVLESGSWTLEDGTLLEVGSLTMEAVVGKFIDNVWETISFASPFAETPVVLSQVQSYNDPGWIGTRQRSASANSFQVAMEAEESATVRHGVEVVGWIAIEHGDGIWSGMPYEAGHTLDSVTHNWYPISFGQNYAQAPRYLAALASYDGGDSSHLRYRSLTSTSVQVVVEEDTTHDKENNHTKEVVDYIAVAADGLLTVPSGVIQPTPVPSPTPRTPQPTNTPTPTPLPSCSEITVDGHWFHTSAITLYVSNNNLADVFLTQSYIDWPEHEGIYLDWLYFDGDRWNYYDNYFTGPDYESPNTTLVEPPRVLDGGYQGAWTAGFDGIPIDWKNGEWTIELTFDGTCVVPYSFQHFEPTPEPSPSPLPTNIPTQMNTPEPTATTTATPFVTLAPTNTPALHTPTSTGAPEITPTPSVTPSCSSIEIELHGFHDTSAYVMVRNDNPVPVDLTSSRIDWPTGGSMYLDWLYFRGYYYYGDDYESPNISIVDPPKTLDGDSSELWIAGFANEPEDWKLGEWTIELAFDDTCVLLYSFLYPEPTPLPPS